LVHFGLSLSVACQIAHGIDTGVSEWQMEYISISPGTAKKQRRDPGCKVGIDVFKAI
jgi:hypothetical protein